MSIFLVGYGARGLCQDEPKLRLLLLTINYRADLPDQKKKKDPRGFQLHTVAVCYGVIVFKTALYIPLCKKKKSPHPTIQAEIYLQRPELTRECRL